MIDDKNVLTANKAFVATALFNVLKIPVIMFPMAIQVLVQVRIYIFTLHYSIHLMNVL